MDPNHPFFTEHQLLEAYHSKRKSRANAKIIRKGALATGKLLRAASACTAQEPGDVADKLTHIVDSAPLAQDDVVIDSPDDVIQRLVKLLKESGDKLNEKITKDHELLLYLQTCFSYAVFENVVSALINSVAPTSKQKGDVSTQKTLIAWTFEMTSRLRALDLQPMNRVMGFGAQYLNQHFTPWIQQHGGWEMVFNSDESDDEVQ